MEDSKPTYKKSTIITPGADLKKSSRDSHYVDNEKFYNALLERRSLVEYAKANSLEPPKVTNYIGKCFKDIAENLSMKYYFRSYPFREDMVGEAIIHLLKNVDSFDPSITKNPFSYYTQTAYYSFIDTIKFEKRELATKFKATMSRIALQELSEYDEEFDLMISEENLPDVSYMSEFLKDFEISLEKKKKKAAARREEKMDIADIANAGEKDEDSTNN